LPPVLSQVSQKSPAFVCQLVCYRAFFILLLWIGLFLGIIFYLYNNNFFHLHTDIFL
jgi:hypothetical protein